MTPDDPRHGERRGYYAHRADGEEACDMCKRAAASAEARYQMLRNNGAALRVDPTGTRRRLRALVAIGWSFRELDRRLGTQNNVLKWSSEDRKFMYATTAAKIAKLYDELSMRLPPENTPEEKGNARRSRNLAARNGWPPPLAWDRIDDPTETPRGWKYRELAPRRDRATILADLDRSQAGIDEVCRVLKIKRDAVEKWCERNGMKAVYRRMLDRDRHDADRTRNQRYRTEGGAA